MFETSLVRDWMTTSVYTVLSNTPVAVAHKIMQDHHIRRLPVMDTRGVIGIVTLGDIREAAPSYASTLATWERKYLWSLLSIDRIMTTRVISLGPETPMLDAVELMLKHKISGLPVVKENALVGIVSESDVFRMMQSESCPVVQSS